MVSALIIERAVRVARLPHVFRNAEVVTGPVWIREQPLAQQPRGLHRLVRNRAGERPFRRHRRATRAVVNAGTDDGCSIPIQNKAAVRKVNTADQFYFSEPAGFLSQTFISKGPPGPRL